MSFDDDETMCAVKIGLGVIGSAVVIGGLILSSVMLGWCGQANDLAMHKVFDPKYEQVRRETFEQSKAYNQGMIQELRAMQYDYVQADEAHKAALKSIILHRFADYDENSLPPDLRDFIRSLR